MPGFKAHILPFIENGGIYAIANIRGGGELGTDWHRAGQRERKQNVFDDFIAAGEWLIGQGYTNNRRLGCFGWSNGGLLVNAVAVQRPDLWEAVVAGSPVTDMVRFPRVDYARHWKGDYGSPDIPGDLEFLLRYSPYHRMPSSIDAPAVLMIVPDGDDRVAPWHGRKMGAQWQRANKSENPVLLLGVKNAGHRGGASVEKIVDKYTNIWAFLFCRLGVC